MKLIPLITWITFCLVECKSHESNTFPPQYQAHHPEPFTSEKQFYLPPENHPAMPYFPMKNYNNLPFPYLPPSANKIPLGSPSPFPVISSTTLLPRNSDEQDDDDHIKASTQLPQYAPNLQNGTQRLSIQRADRRNMRPTLKPFQHPIDRIDTKSPFQFDGNPEMKTQNTGMQSMLSRSIVISDIQRDHNIDQMKTASFQGSQYLPQPNVFISTTETAIPILRLSNEMDLDGSFSYEALGADQTHYVQHSRMENTGADKEEQVVEGSYSYVGDNGKTYTVHYIADSNGFRASGDHLPVPPPIPEIIQRAVQYNLAEELKKPPHLKSWKEEEKENELSESEKHYQFAVSPPRLSNLFTGKTPESFSHSFSQPSSIQHNLVAAASSQAPIQTVDFTDKMHNKQNSGTISPQITFVASQGAHVPSVIAPQNQQQQNIGKIFTSERPSLPQIVNYEAGIKDDDQESNKALWRWQYGINANSNQNMNKNLISRSSGVDDISINFSDMTADQYTKMIQQQLKPIMGQTSEIQQQFENSNNHEQYVTPQSYSETGNEYQSNNDNYNTVSPVTTDSHYSTEKIETPFHSIERHKQQSDNKQLYDENIKQPQNEIGQYSRSRLVTQDQFLPRSQTVTQTYNYDDYEFESRKRRVLPKNSYDMDLNVIPLNYEKSIDYLTSERKTLDKVHVDGSTQKPPSLTTKSSIKFTDFIVPENNNDFKPIFIAPETRLKETTTSIDNILEDNIFLKNIIKHNKNEAEINNKIRNENKNLRVKPIVESKRNNYFSPKSLEVDSKSYSENEASKKKLLDIAGVMNYLSGNQFESNKVRSKPKPTYGNYKQTSELQYFADKDKQEMATNLRDLRTLQQQEELRGVIKNYKVLERNNNLAYTEHDDIEGLKRNLSPPPLKVVNLPPLGRAGPAMKSYIPPVYI